ncbi:hypothetical protein BH11PSE9_BH11PSE9_34350 [soil metagenome]
MPVERFEPPSTIPLSLLAALLAGHLLAPLPWLIGPLLVVVLVGVSGVRVETPAPFRNVG